MSPLLPKALAKFKTKRFDDALSVLAPILKQAKGQPVDVLLLAAQCHAMLKNHSQAAALYVRAAEAGAPKKDVILALAAAMLRQADSPEQALETARKAAKGANSDRHAEATYRRFLQEFLVLDEVLTENQHLLGRMRHGDPQALGVESPFNNICWCDDESINARQTFLAGSAFTDETRRRRRNLPHGTDGKIRVGYLSGDLSDCHPLPRLMQGMFQCHDRSAFDIHFFCNTETKTIDQDRGFRKRHPEIVPISHLDDDAAHAVIRERQLDILIDLSGHTKGNRIGLVNRGCAPVQAAYMGYPGSGTGIDCDYVISDAIVTPDTSKAFYHEKLCWLPHAYFAADALFRPRPPTLTRQMLGLPADKVVFASFNSVMKITPETAEIWASILKGVPQSVLWIMCVDRFARGNLTRWMEARGIPQERIVFATSIDYLEHMARLPVADIGLETFPYNGHTTTVDMLWCGVPVITARGRHFASRVSESLLRALDLPDLVVADKDRYVEKCVSLANDPKALAQLKARIRANIDTAPLFQTEGFTRDFEKALTLMVERSRAGRAPDHIVVPT